MKAYPLKFNHPYEAVVLKGIKDVTAKRLASEYDKYCVGMGIPKPSRPIRSLQSLASELEYYIILRGAQAVRVKF